MTNREQRILELKKLIEELKSRLPAHSVKPQMLRELEELEEELENLRDSAKQ